MCGIGGFLNFGSGSRSEGERKAILKKMGDQIAHRGPDDEQFYLDDDLSFVFRRLSIIDVQGGRQPIWNEEKTLFVSVNGEIFNHKALRGQLKEQHHFTTQSDSEIVLHLFEERGPKAFELLVGQFAVVLWDKKRKKLFLARDQLGIKPFFHARTKSGLIFGSEIKALLAHPECPRDLNWDRLEYTRNYLVSPIRGMEALPAGHYAEVDVNGAWKEHQYWNLKTHLAPIDAPPLSFESTVERCGDLLEQAVVDQLMSDVPMGAFLSGGLDSSLVVAIAGRHRQGLHCLSIVEQNSVASGDAFAARALAENLKAPFHPVLFNQETFFSDISFTLSDLENFVWLMECPGFHVEWVFKHQLHRYAKTVAPDLKVILLGQGADEFAGGYSKTGFYDTPNPTWDDYIAKYIQPYRFSSSAFRLRIPSFKWDLLSNEYAESLLDSSINAYQEEMLWRTTILQNYNLWHEDRTSASQGIEARVPFLDHRLVEFFASIPPINQSEFLFDKKIIRTTAKRFLPKQFTERPKVPFISWSKENLLGTLVQEILRRTANDFVEKYLGQSHSVFAKEPFLRRLKLVSEAPPDQRLDKASQLIAQMGLEIFAYGARNLPRPVIQWNRPPSRLTEITSLEKFKETEVDPISEPPVAAKTEVKIRWASSDVPIRRKETNWQITVSESRAEAPPQTETNLDVSPWQLEILTLLSHAESKMTIRELHHRSGVSAPEFVSFIDHLTEIGAIEK